MTSSTALITILLPVFNAASTLGPCLSSIQRQSFRHWRCLLLDDGSTDDSLLCAKTYALDDDRIEIVQLPHTGLIGTLNAGIDRLETPFVARMDADDLMHRDRLALQLELMQNSTHAAVGCHVRLFPRRELTAGRRAYEQWLNQLHHSDALRTQAYIECPLAHPTLLLRSDILRAFRYEQRGWPEDYDLLLRLLNSGHTLGVVPRRLLLWRDHPQRLSRTAADYRLDAFTRCRAHHLAQGFLRGAPDYILWGYGKTGRQLCNALKLHGKMPSHIVEVHPRRIGENIAGAPVIPVEALPGVTLQRIVVSVAGAIPRDLIRAELDRLGLLEGNHYVFAA